MKASSVPPDKRSRCGVAGFMSELLDRLNHSAG
jgi:hypothetical protein